MSLWFLVPVAFVAWIVLGILGFRLFVSFDRYLNPTAVYAVPPSQGSLFLAVLLGPFTLCLGCMAWLAVAVRVAVSWLWGFVCFLSGVEHKS